MGHDSARAAMIYQHATAAADRLIAHALDRQIGASRNVAEDWPGGNGDQLACQAAWVNGTSMARALIPAILIVLPGGANETRTRDPLLAKSVPGVQHRLWAR